MNADNEKSVCISDERLSAHFDGELQLDKEELKHLDKCARCSGTLKEFAYLAELLKKSMQVDISPGLNEKIIRKARKGEEFEDSIPFSFSALLVKAASFVLIAALMGVLVYNHLEPRTDRTAENKLAVSNSRQTEAALQPEQKTVFLADVPRKIGAVNSLNNSSNGNIDYSNFARVSTGIDHKTVPFSTVSNRSTAINPLVEHLWIADNPEKAADFVRKFIPEGAKVKFEKNNNSCQIAFRTNKAQAVEIVKKLHKAGFKLISPEQPQPEQNVFPGSSKDNIIYRATFTRN
jgi:hypothetical protein